MRKVFQSYDGLIFEDEDECVEYERDNPLSQCMVHMEK